MLFENALVALRKGYKVQRRSTKKRLNAVCLYMENGYLYSEQTHELSSHKKEKVWGVSIGNVLAEDWEVLK